ncbi:DNA-binding transcriptional LysR family regulator [Comamonas sp. BIGb0124]|uniref:LysR family transcriptional regulator n=1 Tax=Comamonas sp. BIGb0124 TaxID=2485130 RepID=UPI000F48350E|nr:LysR family transcriptional regulator [Comamonas sp. BIGb0124]ROR25206.1 DNA-binding transcriptional LysR family regulator [Comamonas sp. BIGb0124]
MLHITLRQMQIFAAVARAGSTPAAAQDIGLSQSATSAALNELESSLGLPLFDRVGRRLRLNGHGQELLPRVLAVVDGARAIESWALDDAAGAGGLRIGASTTIGNYLLPGVLATFRRSLPPERQAQWNAHVSIANTQAIASQVAGFELDLGLIEGPCHEPELTVMPWLTDELVIVAGAGSRWHRKAQDGGAGVLPLAELARATWLLREAGSGTRETIVQMLMPHVPQLHEGIQFANSEAIKQAVSAGLGITCLSRWVVADALASGRLVELATPLPPLARPLSLVLHRAKSMTPGLLRLVEHVRRGLPEPSA